MTCKQDDPVRPFHGLFGLLDARVEAMNVRLKLLQAHLEVLKILADAHRKPPSVP